MRHEWHHYAVTWDAASGERSHYVDGELVGEPDTIAVGSKWLQDRPYVTLGMQCLPAQFFAPTEYATCNTASGFDGEMDDVAVFAGTLSAAEVGARWNRSLSDRRAAGLEPSLILFYNFNEAPSAEGWVANLGTAGSDGDLQLGTIPKPRCSTVWQTITIKVERCLFCAATHRAVQPSSSKGAGHNGAFHVVAAAERKLSGARYKARSSHPTRSMPPRSSQRRIRTSRPRRARVPLAPVESQSHSTSRTLAGKTFRSGCALGLPTRGCPGTLCSRAYRAEGSYTAYRPQRVRLLACRSKRRNQLDSRARRIRDVRPERDSSGADSFSYMLRLNASLPS